MTRVEGMDLEEVEVKNCVYDEVLDMKASHQANIGQFPSCQPQLQVTKETSEQKAEEIDQ